MMAGRWSWSTENLVSEFKDLQASAMAVDCLGNWCLLAGRKNLAFVNLNKLSPSIKVTRQSKWDIGCVQWNMHASCAYRFVTACNQRLDVFDFRDASAAHLCSMKAHSRTVSDIDWSPFDVNVVASCSVDTFTYFWDVRDAKKPVKYFQTVTGAYQVKWNKVTNNLFATTHDGDVRIWDPRKGNTPIQYIAAHPSKIHGLDWSNTDQNKFVTASQDCTIRLWDCNSPQRSEALINSGSPVWRARYTPFGEGIVSVVVPQLRRGENSLYLWHPSNQQAPVHTFMGHKDVIQEFQWRKQQEGAVDHHLVTWSKDQSLRIWKVDPALQESCGHHIRQSSLELPVEQQGYGGRVQNVTSAKDNIPQNYKKPLSEPGQESKQKSKGEDTADVTAEREGLTVQTQLSSQFTVLSTSASVLSSGVMLGPGGSSFTSSDWYQAGRAGRAGTPGLGGGGGGVGGAGGGSAGVAQPLGAVGGNVPSLSGLMSVVSLEQEMDEVQRARFPGIKLDQADFVKRTCVIKLAKASFHMDVHLSFPDNYPVKISPRLNILSSNLDPDTEARVIRAYNESCSRHVKQHVNCVEPCMKQMVQAMERMSTSPLEQTQEERKLMLEKKFAVEKVQVRSPTSPAQSAGVIPMYATGSFIFRIPFPRTSGARFCSNDRLVTFGVPASMKKIQEENEVTPRALSDFMAIMMAQSPWMRNQPSTFGPMGLFYGSSPHSSAEEVSISSFYVEKANKTRHQRHHGQSHYKPHYRPRESMDAGKRVGAGGDRDSERSNRRLQKVGAIKIYDIACINPVSKDLAEKYKLDLNDIQGTCEHNATVAREINRMDLAQVWQLVAHMSHPSIRPSPNPDHGPPFAFTPFGRPLLKRMLEHYGRMRDVQTMAMLCCIFWDRHPTPGPRDRDALALQAGPGTSAGSGSGVGGAGGALSLSRNHSRTSLEYGAAAANQGEVLMATSSDSGYYLLPVMKSKRSSSWSESFDDFKILEDKDPREREAERERILHHNNSKMLDPDLWYRYERIKHSYANILFKWGLLNQRRQVLKHTVAAEADIKGIEVNVTCWNCSREVRGAQCTECSYPALQCSICHIGVRGAANMCIACGHGGHLAHLMEWFKEYDVCPTGCGCHCLQENIF